MSIPTQSLGRALYNEETVESLEQLLESGVPDADDVELFELSIEDYWAQVRVALHGLREDRDSE